MENSLSQVCKINKFESCRRYLAALRSKIKLQNQLSKKQLGSLNYLAKSCSINPLKSQYWCKETENMMQELAKSELKVQNSIVGLASLDLSRLNAHQLCQAKQQINYYKDLKCDTLNQFVKIYSEHPKQDLKNSCNEKKSLLCDLFKELSAVSVSSGLTKEVCDHQQNNAFCYTIAFAQQFIQNNPTLKPLTDEEDLETICAREKFGFCNKEDTTVNLVQFDGRNLQKLCETRPKLLICKTISLSIVKQLSDTYLCNGPGIISHQCKTIALAELDIKSKNKDLAHFSKFNSLAKIEIRTLKNLCDSSPKMLICHYVEGLPKTDSEVGIAQATTEEALKAICLFTKDLAVCDHQISSDTEKSGPQGRLIV